MNGNWIQIVVLVFFGLIGLWGFMRFAGWYNSANEESEEDHKDKWNPNRKASKGPPTKKDDK